MVRLVGESAPAASALRLVDPNALGLLPAGRRAVPTDQKVGGSNPSERAICLCCAMTVSTFASSQAAWNEDSESRYRSSH